MCALARNFKQFYLEYCPLVDLHGHNIARHHAGLLIQQMLDEDGFSLEDNSMVLEVLACGPKGLARLPTLFECEFSLAPIWG
jgi:hypothetical protein